MLRESCTHRQLKGRLAITVITSYAAQNATSVQSRERSVASTTLGTIVLTSERSVASARG